MCSPQGGGLDGLFTNIIFWCSFHHFWYQELWFFFGYALILHLSHFVWSSSSLSRCLVHGTSSFQVHMLHDYVFIMFSFKYLHA
ncbi:hypothetical protein Fmac_018116 [Flemingia macrophylla]|uniref:Uncharacterized protein n=1 Tax=Flemingia macrophylla TaxID=520843 RepID=A0ABD1M425_9FABA